MNNPGIHSSDIPHSLHLDALSGVAEDASTLAAAQAQHHQHDIQEHVPSAESTDAQSLHPLQTAVGVLDSYSIQQQEEQNDDRSFRESYNLLVSRPPGTPKSDDPNKKKRKRTARQRDLCDVKIKITEYFPGYSPMMIAEGAANDAGAVLGAESMSSGNAVFPPPDDPEPRDRQPFGVLTPNPPLPEGHPGANGQRFFTIQRVNGNGANGKNDGVSGGHRHTLEESDRVKKNSVQRYLLKEAREKKKASSVTLEAKGIPYQYIEVDPYKKPQSLLEVDPRGLVPALRHGDWGSHEMPNFYRVLQEQDEQKQISNAQELKDAFATLVNAADSQGPFFLGANISFVDVQVAPWIIRLSRVLKPYRAWPDPDAGSRWGAWVNAIEANEHVKATTSDDELYIDSYERYARRFP
ncbi:unnamed protein product [Aspergillus oryzae]|nr:unnamed protein product [Aspergillus oryzae]